MIRKLTSRLVLKAIHTAALRIHASIHRRAAAATKECNTILAGTTDPARRNEAVTTMEQRLVHLQGKHDDVIQLLDSVEQLQERAATK